MQFKIAKRREVKTLVEFFIQVDEDKPQAKVKLDVWFKIQPKSVKKERDKTTANQLKQLSLLLQGKVAEKFDESTLDATPDPMDSDTLLGYLREDITGIDGVIDEDEQLVEYSEEVREAVLEDSAAREAIELKWRAIQDDTLWKREKRKN